MPRKRILCATDFSASAAKALEQATALASALSAEILLLHVFQRPPGQQRTVQREDSAELDHLAKAYERQLDELTGPCRGQGLPVTCVLAEGPAWERILCQAKALNADMIVIGRNGRAGLSQLFVGTTAARIVKNAHVPVLTVRA